MNSLPPPKIQPTCRKLSNPAYSLENVTFSHYVCTHCSFPSSKQPSLKVRANDGSPQPGKCSDSAQHPEGGLRAPLGYPCISQPAKGWNLNFQVVGRTWLLLWPNITRSGQPPASQARTNSAFACDTWSRTPVLSQMSSSREAAAANLQGSVVPLTALIALSSSCKPEVETRQKLGVIQHIHETCGSW